MRNGKKNTSICIILKFLYHHVTSQFFQLEKFSSRSWGSPIPQVATLQVYLAFQSAGFMDHGALASGRFFDHGQLHVAFGYISLKGKITKKSRQNTTWRFGSCVYSRLKPVPVASVFQIHRNPKWVTQFNFGHGWLRGRCESLTPAVLTKSTIQAKPSSWIGIVSFFSAAPSVQW